MAPEILFQPEILDLEQSGISESLFKVINGAEVDLRSDFYKSIILSGGTTLLPGFCTRLQQDMRAFYADKILKGNPASGKVKIKVNNWPDRKYSAFTGASILANIMKDRDEFWLTKKEWSELGADNAMKKMYDMKI